MDELAQALRRTPGVSVAPRIVTSVSPLLVDVAGSPRPAVNASSAPLVVGDVVLTAQSGGVTRVLSSLAGRPGRGTVTAVAAPYATVSVAGVDIDLAYVGTAPTVGATVAIQWDAAGSYITGTLSTATVTQPGEAVSLAPPPAPAPSGATSYTLTARAITVCSASGGSWTTWGSYGTTAVQGAWTGTGYKSGFFFYGSVFGGAAGRTCTAATVRLKRGAPGLGSSASIPAHLRLHTGATKGATPPGLTADAESVTSGFGFGQEATVALPAAWGQKLLDGTAAGIALVYAGTTDHAQWLGVYDLAAAGQITLTIQEA